MSKPSKATVTVDIEHGAGAKGPKDPCYWDRKSLFGGRKPLFRKPTLTGNRSAKLRVSRTYRRIGSPQKRIYPVKIPVIGFLAEKNPLQTGPTANQSPVPAPLADTLKNRDSALVKSALFESVPGRMTRIPPAAAHANSSRPRHRRATISQSRLGISSTFVPQP